MGLVISDEFLQMAHISEADLKLEIAILLLQQEKISLDTASGFAGLGQLELQHLLNSRTVSIKKSVESLQPDLSDLQVNGFKSDPSQTAQADILQQIEQRRTFSPAQHQLPDTLTLLQEDRARWLLP